MENRMMLSASMSGGEVLWPLPSSESESVQQTFGVQVFLTGPIIEGGYVEAIVNGTSGTYDMNDGHTPIKLNHHSLLQTASHNGVNDTVSWFDSDGIAARVIEFPISPIGKPLVSHPERKLPEVPASDGGLILIRPLLNPETSGAEPNKGESYAALIKSSAGAEIKSVGLPDAAGLQNQISGEWARAAVFEIAGGEPAHKATTVTGVPTTPASAFIPAFKTKPAEPSTGTNANTDENQASARSAPALIDADKAPADVPNKAASAAAIGDATPPTEIEWEASVAQAEPETSSSDEAPRAGCEASPSPAPADQAIAAAFDELGKGEIEFKALLSDYPRLNSWLGGTPLLLIFALDRVTARRSRTRQSDGIATHDRRPETM